MAKYLTIFVIFMVALASFLTLRFAKESYTILPLKEVAPPPVNLEIYSFHEWHEYSSPKGKFKVLLPALPHNATKNVLDPKTNKIRKYDMYVSEKNDGSLFVITLITFADALPITNREKLMKEMVDDMVESKPDNELRTIEASKFHDYDSLDFAFGNKESMVDAKTFIVGNTLYILSRVAQADNYNTNEYNFFVNSFDLTSSPTPDEDKSKGNKQD